MSAGFAGFRDLDEIRRTSSNYVFKPIPYTNQLINNYRLGYTHGYTHGYAYGYDYGFSRGYGFDYY